MVDPLPSHNGEGGESLHIIFSSTVPSYSIYDPNKPTPFSIAKENAGKNIPGFLERVCSTCSLSSDCKIIVALRSVVRYNSSYASRKLIGLEEPNSIVQCAEYRPYF